MFTWQEENNQQEERFWQQFQQDCRNRSQFTQEEWNRCCETFRQNWQNCRDTRNENENFQNND